jgi:(S)-sulfolactate dehydrogenase
MPDIVITEFMDETVVAEAFAGRDALYDPGLVDKPDALRAALAEARALIVRNRTQVRAALLDAAPKLKVVGRLGVGLDNIDQPACRERGLTVIPATGANDLAVAEYVITAALVLLRGAWGATASVAAGEWPRMALIGREASGKTLGFVGFGAIARETAARARALGLRTIGYDPFVPREHPAWEGAAKVDLGELLGGSDIVSLHVPLTDETRGMIDAAAIAAMKPRAILINAARGGVVDEEALAAGLRSGKLGGAALDVFDAEPLDESRGARFEGLPDLLLTPHIAGVTEESNVRVSAVIAAKVLEALDGHR